MFTRPFIYPLVDTGVCAGRGHDPLLMAQAYLRGGARILQLRCKEGSSGSFLELARRMAETARQFDALLIVNDRADVAALARAAGVHVGQEDIPVEEALRVLGPNAAVGVSTHDRLQIDVALAGSASYVAVGPIYQTSTKETGYAARGLELVRYAAGRGKPVVAIGGITLQRVPELIAAGATGLAVISDLAADDPQQRVREYIDALD